MAWYTPLQSVYNTVKNNPFKTIGLAASLFCTYHIGKFSERNFEQRIESACLTPDIDGDGIKPDLGVINNGRVTPLYLSRDRKNFYSKEGLLKRYQGLDRLVNKPYTVDKEEDKNPNPMGKPVIIPDLDTANKPQTTPPESNQKPTTFQKQQGPTFNSPVESDFYQKPPIEKTASYSNNSTLERRTESGPQPLAPLVPVR